ncbi:hypothetical protein [Bosea sp. ANAM02]|uniref:hypothetical protein n=1 Tax=Bosea sp. ANAM02 TaxID=2020412 RepID=UPI001564BEC3|nr:hypothetical protein [Bosea sp. ANAM02]
MDLGERGNGKQIPRKEPTRPVSIRLTEEERSRLVAEAGKRTLGEHIRTRLLNGENRPRRWQEPKADSRQLAHVLAMLGQSDLGPMLREMLHAARVGALPITPDTEAALQSDSSAILDIRRKLMVALGLIERGADDH